MTLHDKLDGLGIDFTEYDALCTEHKALDDELHAMKSLSETEQNGDAFRQRRAELRRHVHALSMRQRTLYVTLLGFPGASTIREAKKLWHTTGSRRGWRVRHHP